MEERAAQLKTSYRRHISWKNDTEVTMHYARMIKCPEKSFFLFGPRGTGKSTWLRETFPNATWVDLLDERKFQAYLADPCLFAGVLEAAPDNSWVVVNEIHRLPNLLNEVHRFIEKKGLLFALSGSGARKLKRSGINLLAGRASRKFLPIRRMVFDVLPTAKAGGFLYHFRYSVSRPKRRMFSMEAPTLLDARFHRLSPP
ncbi:MAG: AAA family ATPase, partial [Deltaproteobacteria bacterium]|nr:AAA family ATPase [Deltaproteobacteria bacterium]